MSWHLILLLLLAAWVGSNLYALAKNYLKARKTGFPLVICPVNPNHVIWMVTCVPLRPIFKRFLPDSLFHRLNMSIYGWEAMEKFSPFAKYGQNFVFVTCGNNELNIAEPELAIEVLKRPKDFIQTEIGSFIMRLFGENLITSDGESWSRQRKLIAPNINERISKIVFQESCRQTVEMMDNYANNVKGVTDDAMNGLKTIAINVLATAGYGVSWPWKQEKQDPQPGYRMTYIEATRTAVDHIVEAAVMPVKLLLLPFMPTILQNVGHAVREFPAHTKQMLDSERKRSPEDSNGRTNLMSILVKEVVQGTEGKQGETSKPTQRLSESEITGNLFVFTAAGFDTTANTMAYAVTLLATYPKWQKWLFEELDEVLRDKGEELEYVEIFPKLTRCLALMVC
jgi:cytochrome P450